MIDIEVIEGIDEGGALRLGSLCKFRIVRHRPGVEVRWFVHFDSVLQIRPMCEWSADLEELEWLPESPGRYRLAAEWRDGGERGFEEIAFEARPNVFAPRPTKVSRGRLGRFWTPNEYESKGVAQYETALFGRLPALVAKGSVVYDVGANIGLFSVPLSRRVGETGRVICVEPNPICVLFLKANLEGNGCRNAQILPVALAADRCRVPFTLNFGNSLLGLTQISGLFHHKAGQGIDVEGRALDELRDAFRLPAPDLIKMDVEGAEGAAVRGMAETLATCRPVILMEIHGPEAAREVAEVLDPLGCRYEEAEGGRRFRDSEELAEDLERGAVIRQVICTL